MNKRILIVALAAACGVCAISATAFAQSSTDSQQASQSSTAKAQPAAKKKTEPRHASPLLGTNMCIRDTGSLIPPPKGQCLPVPGNSYSRQDILRTGAGNVSQALQMLDPSITAHGH